MRTQNSSVTNGFSLQPSPPTFFHIHPSPIPPPHPSSLLLPTPLSSSPLLLPPVVGLNAFSDLTFEEFRDRYLITKPQVGTFDCCSHSWSLHLLQTLDHAVVTVSTFWPHYSVTQLKVCLTPYCVVCWYTYVGSVLGGVLVFVTEVACRCYLLYPCVL